MALGFKQTIREKIIIFFIAAATEQVGERTKAHSYSPKILVSFGVTHSWHNPGASLQNGL